MTDVCPWHDALPRPPVHGYDTPHQSVHAALLMRCAERYKLTDY